MLLAAQMPPAQTLAQPEVQEAQGAPAAAQVAEPPVGQGAEPANKQPPLRTGAGDQLPAPAPARARAGGLRSQWRRRSNVSIE